MCARWSWLVAAAVMLHSSVCAAATATSRAAGNWNANATWTTTRGGTITSSTGSATVTGVGTSFTSELAVGVVITLANDTVIGTVQSIGGPTSLTLTGNAASNNSGVAYAARVAPVATDMVQILVIGLSGIALTADATCAGLTFLAAGGTESLQHGVNVLLTVNGNVTINGSNSSNSTKSWSINAGRAMVNGNVTLVAGSNASRIASIFTTTRSALGDNLTITGSLTMINAVGAAATVISMSGGNGVLNLAGAFNVNTLGTLTPGATSTFNFNGAAAQTIPIGVSSVVYRNLHTNNTSAGGATLGAAVTAANVLGNIRVQTGILNNGGFAIASGGGGTVFEVANGTVANPGRFNLTGTTAMATGFTTKTFGATSTVNYQGGNQAVGAETYGHLILDGGSTKTPAVGTTTVAGDFTLGASTTYSGSNNPAVNLAGKFTNSGTAFTSGTGIYTFNGSSAVTPQTLTGATTFTNMTVNNTGIGLRLASPITVGTAAAGGLILTDGNIDTQSFSLSIARNCNVSPTVPVDRAAPTAGWIVGNLIKTFPTTGSPVSCSFEVGDASNYTPLTSLSFASVSTAGTAQVRTDSGDHIDTTNNISGIDASNSVNRTWTLSAPPGTTIVPSATYSATFNFINPGDLDASPTTGSFVVAKKSGGNWSLPAIGTQGSTSTQSTGMLSAEGDSVFAVGALKRLAEWRMDAATWTDSSGNGYTGTGAGLSGGLPGVANASPAIAGSPGTCGYGVFTRNNKTYVAIPASFPNLGTRSFTITAWIRTTNNTDSGQRVLTDDEHNTGGYGLSVGSAGTGTLRFYSRGTPSATNTDTGNVIANNVWYFVAAVADVPNKRKTVYVYNAAGALLGSNTDTWTESSFGSDSGVVSIGGETNTSTQNTNAFGFGGNIDEVRVYESALGPTHLSQVRQITRACSTLDHLDITGNATGITCAPEDISFTAHDASHNPVAVTGTLVVSTSTVKGDWASVLGGSGFSNGTADDGQASILFSNESSVTLRLTHTYALTSNINALLGGITETSGSASSSDDLSIVWSSAGFRFFQDSTTTPVTIGTQIAGKPSNAAPGAQTLFLRAIKTDNTGACTGVFANPSTVNVDMASQCNNPAACSSQKITLNSTLVASNPNSAVSSYTPVPLVFGSNSQAPVIVNSADAGTMTLFARYTLSPSGQLITGASNAFIVRPFAFRISGAGIPGVAGPGGAVFTRAGVDFPVTVTAVAWEAADDITPQDGVPDGGADLSGNTATLNFGQESSPAGASVTHTLLQPSGGTAGTLSGGSYTGFASGAKTQNLNWSEVGSITLSAALTGGNYLASGQTVTGSVSPVGRFRPDHFIITPGTLTNRRVLACSPAPSTFTYLGEQMRATFALTARNALASPTTTLNYATANSFAKLDGTVIGNFGFGAVDLADATPPAGRTALTPRISLGTSSGTWTAGAGNFTADLAVSRATTPDGPFESLRLGTLPADTDGVTLRTADLDLDTSAPADTSDRVLLGSSKLRFGRLRVQNALGLEKLILPVPVETQYWNGSAFIRNADDSCTTLANGDIVLSDHRLNLNPGETSVIQATVSFVNGTGTLTLSAPGAGNNGSVLLTPTLGVNRPYLQGAWTGTTYNENPSARASFGLFGSQPQNFIFQRENY